MVAQSLREWSALMIQEEYACPSAAAAGDKTTCYKEGHLVHCLHQKWEEVMEGLRKGTWNGTREASLSVFAPAL